MEEKNYIIKETKTPINIGDYLVREVNEEHSFGHYQCVEKVLLTPENVEDYVKAGILEVVGEEKEAPKEENLLQYIEYVSECLEMDSREVVVFLEKLNVFCPQAVMSILLEAVSDCFYAETELEEGVYYAIESSSGKIITYPGIVDPYDVNCALFASVADAAKAKEILHKQFEYMYGE